MDHPTGRVVTPRTIPGWAGFDARSWFSARYDAPVWVDNETNLRALGEWERGEPQERRDLLYVKVATGIGSGLVTGGRLHRGDSGAAGDIGHVRVTDDPAAVCRCGKTGCLEAVAGGWALVRTLTERARAGDSPVLAERLAEAGDLTGEDIGRAVATGDEAARSAVSRAARVTGTAIAGVVNFLNPGTLVLGGGVLRTGDLFFEEFRRAVLDGGIELATQHLTIRTASLADTEGTTGAALLAAENLLRPEALRIWPGRLAGRLGRPAAGGGMSAGAPLAGRVAGLVTGAARGQGRSHCLRLAEDGADIVAFDLCAGLPGREFVPATTEEDLEETVRLVRAAGRRVVAVRGDVRRSADLEGAVARAVAELGGLHVVVANAGVLGGGRLAAELPEDDWDLTLDIDLKGVWLTARAAMPALIAGGGGSMVLIGSAAGLKGVEHLVDYCAAKAGGVVALTRVSPVNGRHGVRVNCVCPGNVGDRPDRQPDGAGPVPPRPRPSRRLADVAPIFEGMTALPGQPLLQPSDVSDAVAWLAGDESRWVTGIVLPVDQGMGLR